MKRLTEGFGRFVGERGFGLRKLAFDCLQILLKAGAQTRGLLARVICRGMQQLLGIGYHDLNIGNQFVFERGNPVASFADVE